MTQLTSAGAGFDDVGGAYTALSYFQYNNEAFGKNVPAFGSNLPKSSSSAEEHANGPDYVYNAPVENTEFRHLANGTSIPVNGLEEVTANGGLGRYNRSSADMANVKVRADMSEILQKEVQNDASSAFHTTPAGHSGERANIKQKAITGSESIVRLPKARTNVWGMHAPSSIT